MGGEGGGVQRAGEERGGAREWGKGYLRHDGMIHLYQPIADKNLNR